MVANEKNSECSQDSKVFSRDFGMTGSPWKPLQNKVLKRWAFWWEYLSSNFSRNLYFNKQQKNQINNKIEQSIWNAPHPFLSFEFDWDKIYTYIGTGIIIWYLINTENDEKNRKAKTWVITNLSWNLFFYIMRTPNLVCV